jgi:hypothetical protein
MKSLLAILALFAFAQCIDITKVNGNQLDWNPATNPQSGNFSINNGINCGGVICPNCNGSKYDVAFTDPNTGLEVIEVDFGWTQVSTNGPNCSAGALLNVLRTVPTGNPPAGYQFAEAGVSWTATATAGANAAAPIQCTYVNPDPRETGAIPSPLGCYKYEWIWARIFPTYNITDAQAKLRWGTKIGGVWTVNNDAAVGINTYKAAETKILISVPAFAEYAVFVGTPPKVGDAIQSVASFALIALLVLAQLFF